MGLNRLLCLFGKTLVGFAVSLALLGFFLHTMSGRVDTLGSSLEQAVTLDILLDSSGQSMSTEKITELRAFCHEHPDDSSCAPINDPGVALRTPEMNQLFAQMTNMAAQSTSSIILAAVLFIIGFALYYAGDKRLSHTTYRIFLSSAISCALAIVYYNLIPLLLRSSFFTRLLPPGSDTGLAQVMIGVMADWFGEIVREVTLVAVFATITLALLVGLLFLFGKKHADLSGQPSS